MSFKRSANWHASGKRWTFGYLICAEVCVSMVTLTGSGHNIRVLIWIIASLVFVLLRVSWISTRPLTWDNSVLRSKMSLHFTISSASSSAWTMHRCSFVFWTVIRMCWITFKLFINSSIYVTKRILGTETMRHKPSATDVNSQNACSAMAIQALELFCTISTLLVAVEPQLWGQACWPCPDFEIGPSKRVKTNLSESEVKIEFFLICIGWIWRVDLEGVLHNVPAFVETLSLQSELDDRGLLKICESRLQGRGDDKGDGML